MHKRIFTVKGMNCAACVSRVERAAYSVDGAEYVSVSLLSGEMIFEGSASDEDIINAVTAAGYGLIPKNAEISPDNGAGERRRLLIRFAVSAVFTLLLMYVSMNPMTSLPLPPFLSSFEARGVWEAVCSAAVLAAGWSFFVSGFRGAVHLSPNMNTLVTLGAGISFVYSAVCLAADISSGCEEHALFFESGAMILTLITLGRFLEANAKKKTVSALSALMSLVPRTAFVIEDGRETVKNINEIKRGDMFAVRPGMSFPADGEVIEGECFADESSLSGESMPVRKAAGGKVFAATVNTSGSVICRAEKTGDETLFGQIIEYVKNAGASKAPVQTLADRIASVFVPAVCLIALITGAAWLIAGKPLSLSVERAVAVLVVSCPCSLGLATPVAVMCGCGAGASHGILFKEGAVLESLSKAKTVAFDKTGTLTKGKPEVTDVISSGESSEEKILALASGVEKYSEHPIASAILKYSSEKDAESIEMSSFANYPGLGASAKDEKGREIYIGRRDFVAERTDGGIPDDFGEKIIRGKTSVYLSCGGKFLGVILLADTEREDSFEAVRLIKAAGLDTVMLTGDSEGTAELISGRLGIGEFRASLLPEEKALEVEKLKEKGPVVMVGDGVNDAPALSASDIGITLSCGTDIALDSSDIVLTGNTLLSLPLALKTAEISFRIIRENLFWAFFYNLCGIPLAAGVFTLFGGPSLSPVFCSLAMSLSSICVVCNALRIYPSVRRQAGKQEKKNSGIKPDENVFSEDETMEKVFKVEGMMCTHCEAHVREALLSLPGVEDALPDHEKGLCTVLGNFDDNEVISAIEKAGYKAEK